MVAEIYNEHITRLIGALEYDINTIVSVSMNDAGEIFNSSKFRKVLSDQIIKTIKANLGDFTIHV